MTDEVNHENKSPSQLWWRYVLLMALGVVLVWILYHPETLFYPRASNKALIGKQAPAFELQDLAGQIVKSESFKGKIMVITFWASWCEPCVIEMPYLENLYQKYKSKNLIVIGVNIEDLDKIGKVSLFVKQNEITFPILRDPDMKAARDFGVGNSIPHNFVIDSDGTYVLSEPYPRKWDSKKTFEWFEGLMNTTGPLSK